jgi:nucleoside-diphosphate-sugar epimerase
MNKALVAGALGVSGRALVNHLASLRNWEVIGLSRRSPEFQSPARHVAVDLLKKSEVDACLDTLGDVTHIFFTALSWGGNYFDEVSSNLAMLQQVVEGVDRTSRSLRKVVLLEGAKYYGAHLGPYKTPAKEDDPRHMPPNFYYDQEDYLKAQSAGKTWSWTALRPSSICGFAVGNPMNMATAIAVYAAICKELRLPFRFPGSSTAYGRIMEMTDAELLAKAMVWAALNELCDGDAFNITNGGFDRWEYLWPRLAQLLQMEYAPPQRLPLATFMSDKEPLWQAMLSKYNLLAYSFQEAAAWPFAEAIFNIEYDVMSDTTKSHLYGFHEFVDNEEMLTRLLTQFQQMRFIPQLTH